MKYDVAIIGSGFGGAVSAYKLSRSGLNVCLLERGPWRIAPDEKTGGSLSPDEIAPMPVGWRNLTYMLRGLHHRRLPKASGVLNKKGLFEIFSAGNINVVCASAMGGGSHVYGGLHARPLSSAYWDSVSSHLRARDLDLHYAAMLKLFRSKPAPRRTGMPVLNVQGLLTEVGSEAQPAWGYGPQRDCLEPWFQNTDFDQEGPFGSPGAQKMTLDKLLIGPAIEQAGLKVQALCDVMNIERHAQGFTIRCRDLKTGADNALNASRIVVAAGAINTVSILTASVEQRLLPAIPALGERFSANADVMAFLPTGNASASQQNQGPYQRMYQSQDSASRFVMLQTGIFGLGLLPLPKSVKRWLARQICIAAIGEDSANGNVKLLNGRVGIEYDYGRNPVVSVIQQVFRQLATRSHARLFMSKKITTVHPLGGAVIADNPLQGVINHLGEVHQIPGLYIADASVFPAALGAPPSLSIAAWASHVADHIIHQHNQSGFNVSQ